MLQSLDPETLGNKEVIMEGGVSGYPWEGEIDFLTGLGVCGHGNLRYQIWGFEECKCAQRDDSKEDNEDIWVVGRNMK